MEKFRVCRDGMKDLVFEGVRLAAASSHEHNDTRWTELALYRTKAGSYVLATMRISQGQGEQSSHEAEVLQSPAGIFNVLVSDGEDGTPTLSCVDKDLLEKAIEKDPAFAGILDEQIG